MKQGKGSIVRHRLPYDVVTGARKRIVNAFSNGVPIYFSMSGGKDSIVLANLIHDLILEGRIDPDLLTVHFVDEEAMHDPVIKIMEDWRRRFIAAGVRFDWYCVEVKHYNCFNALEQDESFICWDSTCPDRWVRRMPKFAITDHPMLRRRTETYQSFLSRISRDGIRMAGVRTAESIQRLYSFRNSFDNPESQLFSPIYDWKDTDVWRYISDHELDFPETYLHLYQIGQTRRQMRLSQFFSIDTATILVRLNEFAPDLMDRVTRREPNAYLAALYWDTEIFRSAVQQPEPHATDDGETDGDGRKDYRALTTALVRQHLQGTPLQRSLARRVQGVLFTYGYLMDERDWQRVYVTLVAGDPKSRTMRAIFSDLAQKGAIHALAED